MGDALLRGDEDGADLDPDRTQDKRGLISTPIPDPAGFGHQAATNSGLEMTPMEP